ncbi:glutathione S-transferase family protein [Paracoccus liaowanqingii]|uniref:Glutathione S-transferase family protein n=1 Tax=Paracoccus liaowanqingii TaxID=2560053 RepID=A0A4P7HMF1_9RHOB|nr:glutathione S-transferase family protein [Paracoccus liaowanqingii]QBX35429.1 glutathione S-transferase family protein [Paracoccus liaowanqingii]
MTAQLWCFGESGNAYKAALTLQLAGHDWQPVYVDFFGGEARGAAFRALNPMGEVPVFREDDLVLTQSAVIQLHIAEKAGKFQGSDRAETLRWLMFDNHKISGQAGPARFLLNFLPEEKRPAGAAAYLQGRLKAAYQVLNDHLADRDWVAPGGPTVADFALCGYLYYPEPFGFDRADWPHIDRWLEGIAALPGWSHPYDLMPGHPSDRAPKEDT